MNSFPKPFARRFIAGMSLCGLVALSATAPAQTPQTGAGKPADATAASKDGTMPGMARGDMHQSMMQNMKKMEAMPMTGDTDRDFAEMMKVHHQGAIDMAELQLKNGKDAKLRAMAKRIISAQQKEIKEFDQWMAGRNAKK